jgi:hypothetical protein
MSDVRINKEFFSPRDNFPVTSSFNGEFEESNLKKNEDNSLEKKNCIII